MTDLDAAKATVHNARQVCCFTTNAQFIDALIGAVRHQAAEELRALVTHPGDYACLACQTHLYDADHIDPEVTE